MPFTQNEIKKKKYAYHRRIMKQLFHFEPTAHHLMQNEIKNLDYFILRRHS